MMQSYIERTLLDYSLEGREVRHHCLVYVGVDRRYLLSAANLYLKEVGTRSLKTSERYANNLKNFFTAMLNTYSHFNEGFWRKPTESDLRVWQQLIVYERDTKRKTKPSDRSIHDNAALIGQFYLWCRKKKLPVAMNPVTKHWVFNFKDESMLAHIKGPLLRTSIDSSLTTVVPTRTIDRFNKSDMDIMSSEDIKTLMNSYKDKVYPAMMMLALATGMREEGCCQVPYIGYGFNEHVRAFPEILRHIEPDAKLYDLTVIEKGKTRTLKVNLAAWKAICQFYLDDYFVRRKLFIEKYPDRSPNDFLFLNKKGEPVSPKMISDQTYHAKKRISEPFPFSFHSTRSWYATQFMIRNLSKDKIHGGHYDAAVEDALSKQIGHSDIKTTYQHYIRKASLIIAAKDGLLDYTLGDTTPWDFLGTSGGEAS